MLSKSEFLIRVHGEVFPLLKTVETERSHALKKWGLGMLLLSIILSTLLYHSIGSDKVLSEDSGWAFLVVITFLLPLLVAMIKLNSFSHRLKEKFLHLLLNILQIEQVEKEGFGIFFPKSFKKILESSKQDKESETKKEYEAWMKAGLFPSNLTSLITEDNFEDKKNHIRMHDVRVRRSHGRSEDKIFSGIVMEFNTSIKASEPILIMQKVNYFSQKYFTPNKECNYQKVQADDSVFDHRFTVYAKNNLISKTVLNKVLLHQILTLEKIYPNAPINLLIENEKMTVTINTGKDMFEFFRLYQSLLKDKFFEQFYDEITAPYKVKDTFTS